jgi:hypothetical protein
MSPVFLNSIIGESAGCDSAIGTMDENKDITEDTWYRIIIPTGTLGCNASKIKITLAAHLYENTDISSVGIGVRSGSTEDYTGAGTQITFDTGSTTTQITAGNTKDSDVIDYSWNDSVDHLIHIWFNYDASTIKARRDNSTGFCVNCIYYQSGGGASGDDSLTADVTAGGSIDNLPELVTITLSN